MADLLTTNITGSVIDAGTGQAAPISAGIAVTPHMGSEHTGSFPALNPITGNTVTTSASTYNVTADKIVHAFTDDSDGVVGKAIVGSLSPVTLSGCSYTAGNRTITITGASNYKLGNCGVSGTGILPGTVIASMSGSILLNSAPTQTVSNGSLTFTAGLEDMIIWGSPVTFSGAQDPNVDIVMATVPGSAKVVICWGEGAGNQVHSSRIVGKGTSKVGTISGMDISFAGAEANFEGSGFTLFAMYDSMKICSDTTNNSCLLYTSDAADE